MGHYFFTFVAKRAAFFIFFEARAKRPLPFLGVLTALSGPPPPSSAMVCLTPTPDPQ